MFKVGDFVQYDGKDCIVAAVVGPEEGSQVQVSYAGNFTWVNPSLVKGIENVGNVEGSDESTSGTEAPEGPTEGEQEQADPDGSSQADDGF